MTTANLELPEVPRAIQEASDEINEGFRRLDSIVQCSVKSRIVTAPPTNPVQGDRYVIPSGSTGAWANRSPRIAVRLVSEWRYITPRPGWIAYVEEDGIEIIFDEATSTWVEWYGGPAGASGGNLTPDSHPTIPNVADDEFEGATLDTIGDRRVGATPWAWRNQSTATVALANGSVVLTPVVESGINIRMIEQVLPGTSWRYRAKIASSVHVNGDYAGLALLNTSNGRLLLFVANNISAVAYRAVLRMNSVTSYASDSLAPVDNSALYGDPRRPCYYDVQSDGTNYYFRISATGVDGTFATLRTEPVATFLGTADRIGLIADGQNGSTVPQLVADWFRRVA